MSTFKSNNETEFIFSEEFNPYTVVTNYIFNDYELSYQAKGLYCQIIQFQNSPTHVITRKGLVETATNGRDSVKRCIDELIEHGFISIIQLRDAEGHFTGTKYKVYQKPIKHESLENICVEPITEKPITEKPITGNLQHKKKIYKKENNKKENKKIDDVETGKPKNKNQSINQNNVDLFLKKYCDATKKTFILSDSQKKSIHRLFEVYGEKLVLQAVKNIELSNYLKENNTPYFFIKNFVAILNNEYKTRVVPADTLVKKQTRFNVMDRRDWDFNELERLEDEYIECQTKKSAESSDDVFNRLFGSKLT